MPRVRAPWVTITAAAALSAMAGIVGPLVVMHIYDKALPNQNEATLLALAFLLAGVVATDVIVRSARGSIVDHVGAAYEREFSDRLTTSLIGSDIERIRATGPGHHQARLAAVETIKAFTCGSLVGLAVDLPLSVAALGLLAAIEPVVIVAPIALIVAFLVPAVVLGKKLGTALTTLSDVDGRRWSFVAEALTNIHTTKSLVIESALLRRYERLMDGLSAQRHRVSQLGGTVRALGESFVQISAVATTCLGAYLVINNQMSLGELSACLLLSGRALQPILQTLGFWVQFQNARVAIHQARGGLTPLLSVETKIPLQPLGELTFTNLTVKGDPKGRAVLNAVNLHVRPSEALAIRGADDAGRLAILQVLSGLTPPSQGSAKIDGVEAHQIDPEWRFRNVAIVPEKPIRFEGTLLEHLTWFGTLPTKSIDADILHELHISQDVDSLVKGWTTLVRANEPQEDLLQRVAIARALILRPTFVVMADASSALDRRGDRYVLEALARRRRQFTLVLLTHRPSYLELADRSVLIADGRLIGDEPLHPRTP